jgi:putative hydrolase of the HAD superfamily
MSPATKAVFLDVLGTLVELEPPWITLREAVGPEVPEDRMVRAVKMEMAYYKEHAHEGRDAESLAALRGRCAAILSEELGVEVTVDELVEGIRFQAYPDAAPALATLRERGLRLVAVSNWDCSLPVVLERCGLGEALDDVVTSASAGSLKPDPAIFRVALAEARCEADEVVHVGDTPEEDGDGAAAAGIRCLIIDRDGGADISSLGEIEARL